MGLKNTEEKKSKSLLCEDINRNFSTVKSVLSISSHIT